MGVITSFLKLFKPAPNDYVDVEKHLNENYDKIDAWAKDLVVNDLTTGGADKAGSAEMVKKLGTEKLDKGNVPATLNNAEKIVAALQGNGGLKFDPDLLYLNDEGTKKVGYYYLDRLADGIFECLEQTEETINNSAKFRDISNKASADRLDNLSESYYSDIDFQNGKIYFQKIGKLIMCTSMIQLIDPLNAGISIIGVVPEGFRPPKTVEIAALGSAVERQSDILGNIDIQSNGTMKLYCSQTFTSVAFRITACWFI